MASQRDMLTANYRIAMQSVEDLRTLRASVNSSREIILQTKEVLVESLAVLRDVDEWGLQRNLES